MAWSESLYVLGKDLEKNAVILGTEKELYIREVTVRDMNWISGTVPEMPFSCTAVTRYHQKEATAEVFPAEDGGIRLIFEEPRRAVSPGQAVVLYDGERVLGGGEAVGNA